jgi:hypothetical protein
MVDLSNKEKIDKLENIENEEELRHVIIDLIKRMGFEDVQLTHQYGNPEYGKDIVASYEHKVDGTEWHAFVVKEGRISGSTDDIEYTKGQISQCFEYDLEDVNGDIEINKVKVVSNGNITNGAKRQLNRSDVCNQVSNVQFWKRDRLIELIDEYFEEYWKPSASAIQEICKNIEENIGNEIEMKRFTNVTIGDKEQKILDIFVEPKLVEREFKYEEEIEEGEIRKKYKEKSDIKLNEIIQSQDNFLITGGPGTGKTRLIEEIVRHYTNPITVEKSASIPIQLSIPRVREDDYDLGVTVEKQLRELIPEHYDRLNTDNFTKLLLIDSIDFLDSDERDLLIDGLEAYQSNHDCRFIVAARGAQGFNFADRGIEARDIRILNFDSRRSEKYVNQFFDDSVKRDVFKSTINETNILEKIPSTPLTISLLSIIYDEKGREIPSTQSDIYKEFTEILIGKLNAKRREDLIEIGAAKRVVSVVAIYMLERSKFTIHISEFKDITDSFLEEKTFDKMSREDIKFFVEENGFMYIDKQNNIGFKHDSFLEFFAAREIYHHRGSDYEEKLVQNFDDPRWQNTAVFFAGRSKDMPHFIDKLLEKHPRGGLRALAVSIGGLGYISQALYMTDQSDRERLVFRALEDALDLLDHLKNLTSNEESPYYRLPVHLLILSVAYWFNYNFRSTTLESELRSAFDQIVDDESVDEKNFETGFKLLLLSTTLAHERIDDKDAFDEMIGYSCFWSDSNLLMCGKDFLEGAEIVRDDKFNEITEEVDERVEKYREVILHSIKQPAYRFNENYELESND